MDNSLEGKNLRSRSWDAYENDLIIPKARSSSRVGLLKGLVLGGMGERRKLPQQGLGRSPRNRSDFEHFMRKLGPFWDLVNLRFINNQIEKIAD